MSSPDARKKVNVELIVVGNELLNGTTLDTNSHWVSKQVDRIGAVLSRKTTVRDNLHEISESVGEALRRKPNWIITIGGLGPTFDDMTLLGVAKALHTHVERNALALRYLKESYRRRQIHRRRLAQSSLKMAEIPNGAIPLPNSIGSAPGVLTNHEGTSIVSLPGVPSEMKAIFKENILPKIAQRTEGQKKRKQLWIETVGVRESLIAPATKRIMEKYRNYIYLKSHPMGFDRKERSVIHFQLISEDQSPKGNLSFIEASKDLRKEILKYGIIRKERLIS